MFNIVIFGAPGSGKGTQSEKLIQKYNLVHISTGDALRAERDSGSELGKLAESYMSKGQLIPDDVMIETLAHVFDEKTKAEGCEGVIFDGFPRTIPQGIALEEMLEKRGHKLAAVISLDVPEEELITRMLKRGLEAGRTDDNENVIKARLNVYHSQTSPLKELYDKKGKLHTVSGMDTVENVFNNIVGVIEKVK
jgi:adenylate kinase